MPSFTPTSARSSCTREATRTAPCLRSAGVDNKLPARGRPDGGRCAPSALLSSSTSGSVPGLQFGSHHLSQQGIECESFRCGTTPRHPPGLPEQFVNDRVMLSTHSTRRAGISPARAAAPPSFRVCASKPMACRLAQIILAAAKKRAFASWARSARWFSRRKASISAAFCAARPGFAPGPRCRRPLARCTGWWPPPALQASGGRRRQSTGAQRQRPHHADHESDEHG